MKFPFSNFQLNVKRASLSAKGERKKNEAEHQPPPTVERIFIYTRNTRTYDDRLQWCATTTAHMQA